MSRLGPALRVRRRQLDTIAQAIAAERTAGELLLAAARQLAGQRGAERRLAVGAPCSAEPWFAAARSRLYALHIDKARSDERLARLRASAIEARARLSLLEAANAAAREADRRTRDKAAQAALDDRTAARWSRR